MYLCLTAHPPLPLPAFRMEYSPRVLLIVCCLPCVLAQGSCQGGGGCQGGFAWFPGQAGQSCKNACASLALVCVEQFHIVNQRHILQAASGGDNACALSPQPENAPAGPQVTTADWAPGKVPDGTCGWNNNPTATCMTSATGVTRFCSCQCGAGTYSGLEPAAYVDLKPSCTK